MFEEIKAAIRGWVCNKEEKKVEHPRGCDDPECEDEGCLTGRWARGNR